MYGYVSGLVSLGWFVNMYHILSFRCVFIAQGPKDRMLSNTGFPVQ